jgi:hypothetical protein
MKNINNNRITEYVNRNKNIISHTGLESVFVPNKTVEPMYIVYQKYYNL